MFSHYCQPLQQYLHLQTAQSLREEYKKQNFTLATHISESTKSSLHQDLISHEPLQAWLSSSPSAILHNPRGPPRSSLSCENLLHLKKSFTTIDLQPRCDPEMTSLQSHHPLQHPLNVVGGQSTCFDGAAEACVDWSQSSGTSPRGLHKQAWAYVEINLQCRAAGALEQITPTRQRMSSWEWIRYSGPRIELFIE